VEIEEGIRHDSLYAGIEDGVLYASLVAFHQKKTNEIEIGDWK